MSNFAPKSLRPLVLLSTVILITCAAPHWAAAQGSTAAQVGSVAPIGPADPLNINVVGEPDLTNTYVVDPAGNIEVPYIGKVHVGGLTPDQAAALVQQKLSDIYTSPQVTLTRTGLGGISVTVTGAVEHQGAQPLRRDAHLNDAVQLAAPTPDADIKAIKITHGLPGQPLVTQTYDLDSFLNSGVLGGNPALQDGDTVYIPKTTQLDNSVVVTGEVLKPGSYSVAPGTTAFDVITTAGGTTPGADQMTTYIQSRGSTIQKPFNFTTAAENPANPQLNPVLQDGDEIVVPLAAVASNYAITGAVIRPGQFPINGVVSLLDAISNAGGLEDRADVKNTKITRSTPHGPIVISVNAGDTKAAATTYLQAGDYIDIPHGSPAVQPLNPFEVVTGIASIVGLFRL